MTDEKRAYEKAICEVAKASDIGDVSDGFHTFNSLYEQRMILFAALVKAYRDKAWKSYRHEDGEYCFGGGWFIVGIDTPEGSYTYHYENKYWDMFDCADLPRAKHWDGHTEADAKTRLMSLAPTVQPPLEEFEWCTECKEYDQKAHCCHRFTKVIRETVEELKVVCCKDCRYAKMTYDGTCKHCTYLSDNFGIDDAVYFAGNDYCSHAERRTDE